MRFGPVSGATLALLFVVAGCGGGGGDKIGRGQVSGVVFDDSGNPVRNALVYVDQGGTRETVTDSSGTYVLKDVIAQDVLVGAETQDGNYLGRNLSRVYDKERDVSVNITLYPKASLGQIFGRVTNSQNQPVSGVRVFARPASLDILSSASAVTDSSGDYVIDRLRQGTGYQLLANDLGRGEATTQNPVIPSGDGTLQDLRLGSASNPSLAAPTKLVAIAYTTTGADTVSRSASASAQALAMESIKRLLDPTRAARQAKTAKSRNTAQYDEPIDVDLFWDEYTTKDTYGFGIYRYEGPSGALSQTFLHDPLAAYFNDGDQALRDGVGYAYEITAISSSYDGKGRGESGHSNSSTVVPLSPLTLNDPVGRTVSWRAVPGVPTSGYTVFAYDRYPGLGVLPISTTTANGTSLSVPGTLTSGRTYYYVIVGSRADGSAKVLSPVDTFVP